MKITVAPRRSQRNEIYLCARVRAYVCADERSYDESLLRENMLIVAVLFIKKKKTKKEANSELQGKIYFICLNKDKFYVRKYLVAALYFYQNRARKSHDKSNFIFLSS